MSTVTRDEFETVKQLLFSAGQKIDQASQKLDQSASQQGINTQAITDLRLVQQNTQAQLDQLAVRVNQMSSRIDSFVFESQRLLTGHADRISKLEGISERLEAILAYLVRKEGSGE